MAVLVLCRNVGRIYTFYCRRKNQMGLEIVEFSCQCSVLVGADLTIVFAGVFGWLLWSETSNIRTFIGVALVLFSGLLTVLTGRKQEAAETRSHTS